jgi:putative ABC transport system substrate-binding protein
LVDLRPDAILGQSTLVAEALAHETRTIPIVFVNVTDPVASGISASLARPGGNITGFSLASSEQGGKWVELLKEIAPRTRRMALLFNPETGVLLQNYMSSIRTAASSFDVEVKVAPVHARDEIEGVVAAQARDPGGGLIVMILAGDTRYVRRLGVVFHAFNDPSELNVHSCRQPLRFAEKTRPQ